MDIKKISLPDFYELRSEWNQLLFESSANSYFLTHEWLFIWMKHFETNTTPYILIVTDSDSGELLGAAPLVIESTKNIFGIPIKRLSFMGNGFLQIDHLDFIVKKGFEGEIPTAFANYIKQHKSNWDMVFLDGLVTSSMALNSLLEYPGISRLLTYTEPCPYLPLPDSWEVLRQQLGKNMRYNLGRYKRKLEKLFPGAVEFQLVKTEEQLNKTIPKLYEYHNLIQEAKNDLRGIFEDESVAGFHNEFSQAALSSGNLRLYSLSVENEIIATLYCYIYGDTILFYQTGYNPEWQQYSPGRLLMAHVIESSINEGAKEFDFLRGDEDYKSSWTTDSRTETRLYAACSLKGHLTLWPLAVKKNLKNFLNDKDRLSLVEKFSPKLAKRISHNH